VESDQFNSDALLQQLIEKTSGSAFSRINSNRLLEDIGEPKLGDLLYSDGAASQKDIERRSRWLYDTYGKIAEKSEHKSQLLKLIEYNKIEICENDGFLEQKTEIEIVICKLMRQRLINDELKHELESHQFQGLLTEQWSLIYSIVKLTKKSIHTLYKKCANVIMTKSTSSASAPQASILYSTLGFGSRKASAVNQMGYQ
jgi:hypothetical protein